MILSTNYGAALVELIRAGEAPIQAIEIGPWMSVGKLRLAQQALPGWTWQFHPSNLISGVAEKHRFQFFQKMYCQLDALIVVIEKGF